MGSVTDFVKRNRYWLIACSVMSVSAYGVGRFATPTRVETVEVVKEVIKEVEKKVTVTGPIKWKTTIRTVPGPQGPERIVERVVEKDPKIEYVDRDRVLVQETVKKETVERDAPRLTLGATAAWDNGPRYGGFLTYRVAGPFVLLGQGEGGATGWSARVGAGITF